MNTAALSEDRATIVCRKRDRRNGLQSLLTALGRAMGARSDPSLMRGAFEDAVRRAAGVHTVRLRDSASRWRGASAPPGHESIVLDIPGESTKPRGVLEATLEPGALFSEWDMQFLGLASQVAVLVLEVDRLRVQLARAEGLPVLRPRRDGAAPLIGSTPAMHALRERVERVAKTDFTVLLEGESGVGKELVARQIHELSGRSNGPFVAINCAALVETLLEAELFGIEDRTATGVRGRRGKFEHADGGTLFLDEVSDLSMAAQAKLLRAIQELSVERVGGQGSQKVDIRIVAATNRSLIDMVAQKLFRPDLYYRLGGVDIRVPPLRERRTDIAELTHYFLERHRQTRRLQISSVALQALTDYHWPGNVRELERLVERAVALTLGDSIELDDLPASVRGEYTEVLMPSFIRREPLRVWACRYARLMLDRCSGNKRETARLLGISSHTLNTYLRTWNAALPPASTPEAAELLDEEPEGEGEHDSSATLELVPGSPLA